MCVLFDPIQVRAGFQSHGGLSYLVRATIVYSGLIITDSIFYINIHIHDQVIDMSDTESNNDDIIT